MVYNSIQEKFRTMRLEIDKLDALLCARMKRTVKVESEMRAVAREMEEEIKKTGEANGVGVEQLRKWVVKLGCPDVEPEKIDRSDCPWHNNQYNEPDATCNCPDR